jgi:hypothetical protein
MFPVKYATKASSDYVNMYTHNDTQQWVDMRSTLQKRPMPTDNLPVDEKTFKEINKLKLDPEKLNDERIKFMEDLNAKCPFIVSKKQVEDWKRDKPYDYCVRKFIDK